MLIIDLEMSSNALLRYFKTLIPIHVILFYIFVSSGLLVNFLQLLSVVIWPFSKQLYRKINCHLAYLFWSSEFIFYETYFCYLQLILLIDLTALAQYWSGSNCVLYIKEEDYNSISKEHSIWQAINLIKNK